MGTHSIVAVPDGNTWKGRYVHWDGVPTGVGAALVRIVNRDGLSRAIKTLTEANCGWSTVDGEKSQRVDRPDRFQAVRGYGVAYTVTEQPDEWVTPSGDHWGAAWAYVLTPDGIVVWENGYSKGWIKRPDIEL